MASNELTSTTQRPPTQAALQRQQMDELVELLKKRTGSFEALLKDAGIDPGLFFEGVRRAIMRNPNLLRANRAEFLQAAMDCAADGLIPDGRDATLTIRKGKVTYDPMYGGMLKVAFRSGQFASIHAYPVFEGDIYHYKLGLHPECHHVPQEQSRKVIAAYAVAKTTAGGIFFEPLTKSDIDKIKAMSQAKNGPWNDWDDQMVRAKAIRRMWKYLPKSAAMDRLAERMLAQDASEDAARPRRAAEVRAEAEALPAPADIPLDVVMAEEPEPEFLEPIGGAPNELRTFDIGRWQELSNKAEELNGQLRYCKTEAELKAKFAAAGALLRELKEADQEAYEETASVYNNRLTAIRRG